MDWQPWPNLCEGRIIKQMELSVASNFDDELILRLKDYPVVEVYGKLTSDIVGGGRSSYMLAPTDRKKLARHVALAKQNGIGFNYLLNAACLDNIETTRRGQKAIRELLDWVSSIEVSAVTLSNPLLLRIVKKNYPQLNVRVSVFANVDHPRKAKYWEDLGADVICLDSLTVNREFKTLKQLRKSVSCELELLANNNCLQSCSLSPTHMTLLAHSSQSKHVNKGFVIDHCLLECSKLKLKDPVNYIRSDWIRPEDIHCYEEIGFKRFKLVERNLPTAVMVNRVKAYSERKYEGNLIDLIQPYGHQQKNGATTGAAGASSGKDEEVFRGGGASKKALLWRLKFLLRPFKVNVFKLNSIRKLSERKGMLTAIKGDAPVYIDNRSLDGFIDRFLKVGCRDVDCEHCRYCHDVASRAVKIDSSYKSDCLALHEAIDKDLETGSMWNYVKSN